MKDYTTEELEAILAERKEQKRQQELARRDAYEAIRAQLVLETQRAVKATIEAVKGLSDFCQKNVLPFREILSEYGQLRMVAQMSFTIQEGDFRVEVRSNKVKKFDERADAAATRLIEFLHLHLVDISDITYHGSVSGLCIRHSFSVDFTPKSILHFWKQKTYLRMNFCFSTLHDCL